MGRSISECIRENKPINQPTNYLPITYQLPDKLPPQATRQAYLNDLTPIERTVLILQNEMKSAEIQELMELKNLEHFKNSYLNPAIEQDFIELTIPDKPTSPNQKYRLTAKGLHLQKELLKFSK